MSLGVKEKRVFISYAREDFDSAKRLYQELKDAGAEPWLDKESIKAGTKWQPAIRSAINESQYFIPIISSNSVQKKGYVQKELREALEILDGLSYKEIFVIPLRIENCKVTNRKINEYNIVDLFPSWEDGIKKVLDSIGISRNTPNQDNVPPVNLDKTYWNQLVTKIVNGKCIPFIGQEVHAPWIELDKDIASKWSKEYGYPLEDSGQLSRVAQFLAIDKSDPDFPKFLLSEELARVSPPPFSSSEFGNTSYAVLADLGLPIYVTTNYDLFMEEALRSRRKVEPISEFCRWSNDELSVPPRIDSTYKPSSSNPLVYHLLGEVSEPRSMVLTERDYFEFVKNLNKRDEKTVLQPIIRQELSTSSLLFIGYSLQDTAFQAIFQGLLGFSSLKSATVNIAVQIPPFLDHDEKAKALRKYLERYSADMFRVHAYLGNVSDFLKDLRAHLDALYSNRR
jgi:hypothetical protein